MPACTRGHACLCAKYLLLQAVSRLRARVQLSLEARLLASRNNAELEARVQAVEATAASALSIATAALGAAKDNTALLRDELQAVIAGLAGDLDDLHNCHKQGQLYDTASKQCSPVVGQPL